MTGAMLLARFFEMKDQGDWDKGLKLWMKLVDENPTNAQIMGQAATYISWDVFRPQDKAISLLEKACELDPENTKWAARLGSLLLLGRQSFVPDERKATARKALGYLERASQLGGPEGCQKLRFARRGCFPCRGVGKGRDLRQQCPGATRCDKEGLRNFANLLHNTHVLLGRVALRDDNLELAKHHLLEAGKTPGSPVLNSYGPDMILARELLEKGEKETVLQYFELCRKFWKTGRERLDLWVKAVEEGKTPDFGPDMVERVAETPGVEEPTSATIQQRANSEEPGRLATSTDALWDAETGQETLTFKGHTSSVLSVAFSPDGRRIVSGSFDDKTLMWDAETGQEMLSLRGHTMTMILSVAFSPDGRRIVSGNLEKTLKVWNAETGQQTLTLKGHTDIVGDVAFSPDGRRIVSRDKTLKVWDAETGQQTLTLIGHTDIVTGRGVQPRRPADRQPQRRQDAQIVGCRDGPRDADSQSAHQSCLENGFQPGRPANRQRKR